MKVLIATFTFPPNKDGVAEAARAMAYGLAERGWQVAVATQFEEKRSEFDPIPGIHVEQFRMKLSQNQKAEPAEEIEKFRAYARAFDPDFIVCHCWETAPTMVAESLFSSLRAKKVLVSHGYSRHLWSPSPRFPWGIRWWAQGLPRVLDLPKMMRQYDAVTVLSKPGDFGRFFDHKVGQWIGYKGLRVIPNGTDIEVFDSVASNFKEEYQLSDKAVVLCVANYSLRKNQALAIRAFRRMNRLGTVLVLIGSEFNEYAEEVRQLDASLKVRYPAGEVRFLEKLGRAATVAAYAACDLFLLTAKAETQPIVLIEAMAAGKPFVSTDTGCVRQMPGGMVAKGEQGLARAMEGLLADGRRRAKLGEAGRQAVETTYDWKKVLDSYERLLLSLNSHAV